MVGRHFAPLWLLTTGSLLRAVSVVRATCPDHANHDLRQELFRLLRGRDGGGADRKRPAEPASRFGDGYAQGQLFRWTARDDERKSPHPGNKGEPVRPEDQEEVKHRFEEHQFNIVASEMVPLDRSLVDFRNKECKTVQYPARLPSTSIIIVFHNEAWSTLLRTVHSIINRSPRELVEEILLVDDASELEYLGKKLDDYVAAIKEVPVRVLRTPSRAGLVKARLLGAAEAKAPTLTFLDAHCECTKGWLEPLMGALAEDRTHVVCPVIDGIDASTFSFSRVSGGSNIGIFGWGFGFHWGPPPTHDAKMIREHPEAALPTPAMAGGLFSMDKELFYHLGTYDEDMEFWGGENIEMSLRLWRCGARISILPCSHVGHVFRANTPHKWPGGDTERGRMISRNTVRTVEVWADEWKEIYYKAHPAMRGADFGDVSSRLQLKSDLNCKSMQWYFDNVFLTSPFTREFVHLGEIKHPASGFCLDTMGKDGADPGLYSCHRQGGSQAWMFTRDGRLRSDDTCLTWSAGSGADDHRVHKGPCVSDGGRAKTQTWIFESKPGRFRTSESHLCLAGPSGAVGGVDTRLQLVACSSDDGVHDPSQHFVLPLD